MLREAGFEVTKFSDLRKHDRDHLHDDQREYWRHLLTCTSGMLASVARARDYERDSEDGDEFSRHRKALLGYLENKRQAEAIDAQVEALQKLAA